MIYVKAILKCDRCAAEVEIRMEYTKGLQGIPEFEMGALPRGWKMEHIMGYGTGATYHNYVCPLHTKTQDE